jgi:hypothetical protein
MATDHALRSGRRLWWLSGLHRKPPRRRNSWTVPLGALGLYLLLSVVMMSPLAAPQMPDSPAQDLANHVSGIIEARNALAEGQLPVRVAPKQNQGERYPIFQFYGNLPYTAGGLACRLTKGDPYKVWKWTVIGFLTLGAFFTYRGARLLWRQALPAVAAGAVFLTAPYLLTDIHGRFAYPELVSFTLLPVVFFYLARAFTARGAAPVLCGAVAWSGLALSHNVTYLYASIFFCLYLAGCLAWRRAYLLGVLRVGAGYLAGLLLTAWYIVPQLSVIDCLVARELTGAVGALAWLTPLGVLLAPTVVPPVPVPDAAIDNPMQFGMQVGWPILAAAALSVYYLRRSRMSGWTLRRPALCLVALFALALFMVWTPFDFWRRLPAIFGFVQFPYRLLMFVVLWGALLSAFALGQAFRRPMRFEHLVLCLLALGPFTARSLSPHRPSTTVSVAGEEAHPEMGRGGASVIYRVSPACLLRTTLPGEGANWAEWDYGLVDGIQQLRFPGEGEFPAPRPGDTLRLEGTVPAEYAGPIRLTVALDGAVLAEKGLPPGPFRLALPIDRAFAGERVRIGLRTDRCLEPRSRTPVAPGAGGVALILTGLRLDRNPSAPDRPVVLTAEQARAMPRSGGPTTFAFHAERSGLVQLPVLYYPRLLDVRVDGREVPYGNLGRFVAVEVGPGAHVVTARFVGVRWADGLSCAAAAGILGAALAVAVRRARRVVRRWRRPGPAMRPLTVRPAAPIRLAPAGVP